MRSEELRVYKRSAYCFDDLRQYGKTQNHNDNGYGVKSGSNVQTKGVRDITESGYEISVFSMDIVRGRNKNLYAIQSYLQSRNNKSVDRKEAKTV